MRSFRRVIGARDTEVMQLRGIGWVYKVQKKSQLVTIKRTANVTGSAAGAPPCPVVFTQVGSGGGGQVVSTALSFIFDRNSLWNGRGSFRNVTRDTQVMRIPKLGWMLKVQKQGKPLSVKPVGTLTKLQISKRTVTNVRLTFIFDRNRLWNGRGRWKKLVKNTQVMNIPKLGKVVKTQNRGKPIVGTVTDTLVTVPPLTTTTTFAGGQQDTVRLTFVFDRQDQSNI